MERQERENKVRVLQNIENLREYIYFDNVIFSKLRVNTRPPWSQVRFASKHEIMVKD